MESANWSEITALLHRSASGDEQARTRLFECVYHDLHRIAVRVFAGERGGHTLQPTALLNEVFLKMSSGATVEYSDRVHFFAVAARQMRRILVDHARSRKAEKRGGDVTITILSEIPDFAGSSGKALDLLDINDALDDLAQLDERTAQVVDLRFFAGLTEEETAEALGVSLSTVRLDWRFARGWLIDRLESKTR